MIELHLHIEVRKSDLDSKDGTIERAIHRALLDRGFNEVEEVAEGTETIGFKIRAGNFRLRTTPELKAQLDDAAFGLAEYPQRFDLTFTKEQP